VTFVKQLGSRFFRATTLAAAAFGLVLAVSAEARADYCGADGERSCTIAEKFPSCNANLVEAGGRCVRPLCGKAGQRPCSPFERTVADRVVKIPKHQPCDQDLKHDVFKNQCFHPDCGREGQRACSIVERIPSCDVDLVEVAGSCMKPPLCGRLGQPASACRAVTSTSSMSSASASVPGQLRRPMVLRRHPLRLRSRRQRHLRRLRLRRLRRASRPRRRTTSRRLRRLRLRSRLLLKRAGRHHLRLRHGSRLRLRHASRLRRRRAEAPSGAPRVERQRTGASGVGASFRSAMPPGYA